METPSQKFSTAKVELDIPLIDTTTKRDFIRRGIFFFFFLHDRCFALPRMGSMILTWISNRHSDRLITVLLPRTRVFANRQRR